MRVDNNKYKNKQRFSLKKSINEKINIIFNLLISNKKEIFIVILTFVVFIFFITILGANSGKNAALKAEIKILQRKNNDLQNELQKLQIEKTELMRPERIMNIAKEQFGLVDDLEKKVEVIKVK